MSQDNKMIALAAKSLVKLASENCQLQAKLAQAEAKERALAVAFKLASAGTIEHNQIMEKAASLVKEDLSVIEKALDLNLNKLLSIGSPVVKEASVKDPSAPVDAVARKTFEEFILSNFNY